MGISETFKALDDPVRRQILKILKNTPLSAGDIASQFDISFPAVSRHLSVLRKAGLVNDYRKGKQVWYELNMSVLEDAMLWIEDLKNPAQVSGKAELSDEETKKVMVEKLSHE